MALQLNVNSYVTVNQANDYFSDRVNTTAWDAFANQDEALVTATGLLNQLTWNGTATPSSTLPLAWPRNITFYNSVSGSNETLNDDRSTTNSIPEDIKNATCELAYHLVINTDLLDNTSTVGDLTVRGIRLINVKKASELPSTVTKVINKYLSNGGGDFRTVFVGN